jgi:hypothetical protein
MTRQTFAAPARAPGRDARDPAAVPLGQVNCGDWNAAGEAGRPALAARLRAFAGGVVNTGERDVGTGAVLSLEDTQALYATWCRYRYAEEFLLYKLYTHAAAFARRR